MKPSAIICICMSIFTFTSCKDDVDVNAPWKDVAVIYGLLNKADSVHYIKVNKVFLGPEDALKMAQIKDSSQYENVTVSIKKYKNGVATADPLITLRDTLITTKEEGVFYAPEQTVFYFKESLDISAEYHLEVKTPTNTAVAKTPIINTFTLSGGPIFGNPNPTTTVAFSSGENRYADQTFSFTSLKNGKAYQLIMTFSYTEYYYDGSFSNKSFDWFFPLQTSYNTLGSQSLSQKVEGEQFFKQIASYIKPRAESANVEYRKFKHIGFKMYVAGDELNTYLEVNKPSTGLVFEKPEYSNIENGIGIFSTRVRVNSTFTKNLSDNSLLELYNGVYTRNLGFCGGTGIYACPEPLN